ncbi:MAG: DUF4343 domain-containing protein [Verrucomicrobiaceae bacterium]|nr:MAG: DUF4343 domain-containing protein [Verrucomicrobiaceae bacterium]
MEIFKADPILHWQDLVCREFVKLRPVAGGTAGKVPAAFEFRTFWWRGQLVGEGRYWRDADLYSWSPTERDAALAVAARAVAALGCIFPVIDLAQKESGEWIVIECNDGMESGYAAVPPISIWQAVVDIERARGGRE